MPALGAWETVTEGVPARGRSRRGESTPPLRRGSLPPVIAMLGAERRGGVQALAWAAGQLAMLAKCRRGSIAQDSVPRVGAWSGSEDDVRVRVPVKLERRMGPVNGTYKPVDQIRSGLVPGNGRSPKQLRFLLNPAGRNCADYQSLMA